MSKKIKITSPMRIYDDRGKTKQKYIITTIFYEDDKICLCELNVDSIKILFEKETGKILTDNFQHWYVENYEKTEGEKKAKVAMDFVRNRYIEEVGGKKVAPFMLLGDVAALIESMTGAEVCHDDLLLIKK